jgi:FMN reductase [NAD(P)H]
MDISEVILKRKSIRAYIDKAVSKNDLDKIVEAGRWAPNAGPFQISVISNPALLKKINDRTHNLMLNSENEFLKQRASLPGYQPLYGAPVVILLSGPDKTPFPVHNTVLAAENILLEATGLGLGSCFLISATSALHGEKNRDIAKEAGIPNNYSVQCAVAIGHAAAENRFTLDERAQKGSVNYLE